MRAEEISAIWDAALGPALTAAPAPEREYELLLAGGRIVTWTGATAEEAARRYVDAHRDAAVVATRPGPRHGLHIGTRPIMGEPGR